MPNEIQTTANKPAETVGEKALKTAAGQLTNIYLNEVVSLNEAVGVNVDETSKKCATNVLLQLCNDIGAEQVQNLPKHQLIKILQFVTINQLDVFSGQVFLDKRKDKSGRYVSVNATPMGNALEIMTARFGVGVKKVHQARVVHEGDELELPQYEGLSVTPLKHKTTLKGLDGKAIAIYYIIEKDDGTLEYAISTREQVAKNLMSQIQNNALGHAEIDRGKLMSSLEGKTLDELLTDKNFSTLISPAYRSPATREQMIITKMKKNALLHYTRDLGTKNPEAYAVANSDIEDKDDMVVSVQTEDDASKEPAKKTVIKDFAVDDDGVVEGTPKIEKTPANPSPKVEVEVTNPPKHQAIDEEVNEAEGGNEEASAFNTGDL